VQKALILRAKSTAGRNRRKRGLRLLFLEHVDIHTLVHGEARFTCFVSANRFVPPVSRPVMTGYRSWLRGAVMAADIRKRWKEKSAKYISTLVYLDEPQVVLLDHGFDAKIVGAAIDKEGFDFPFFGAEISFSQWERYNRQFVDLRYLFLMPRWKRGFIFDLGAQDNEDMIPLQQAGERDHTNEKYLPSHGFWARSHTEDNPTFEPSANVKVQEFAIDGTWDPPDISQFFARINDLYSFFLGIGKFISANTTHDQKRALVEAFTDNTLHSGFNYVNFYGDLRGLVGYGERLAMPAIVKKSPGFVRVEGVAETLHQVGEALATYEVRQELLKDQYNDLHNFLSRMKLLKTTRASADRLERNDPISKEIGSKNSEFAANLGVNLTAINQLTGKNALSTAKILLSHHRRLERYHLFFVEGRVRPSDGEEKA
jgi:hypothetical protein